jgi:Ras-related GTP-binding protein A/B
MPIQNLWDCGGQENFLAHFISTQKSEIFKNVAVLIYVFDATTPFSFSDPSSSSGVEDERQAIQDEDGTGKLGRGKGTEWEKDVGYFEECLEALYSLAKEEHEEMYDLPPSSDSNEPSLVPPKVWVLINKMDLIGDGLPAKKLKMFQERRDDIERRAMEVGKRYGMKVGRGKGVRCFGTSIWDESLYKVSLSATHYQGQELNRDSFPQRQKAWSSVIHTLIPNASLITSHLTHLRDISSCVEAVLFERQTFLVLAKSGSGLDADPEKGSGLLMGEEDEDVDGSGGFDEVELRGGAKGLERKRFEKISEVVKGFRTTCQ